MRIRFGLGRFAAVAMALLVAACAGGGGSGDGSSLFSLRPGSSAATRYLVEEVGDRAFFATDQATLDGQARGVLLRQAAWLDQNGGISLTLEGHADERGTREYNLALGSRRAHAVRDFLISQGVDAGRLYVISYGKERPVSLCPEEACWSKNRRVVAVIR